MRSLKITLILAIVCLALVGLTTTNNSDGAIQQTETVDINDGAKIVTGGTIKKDKHDKPGQNQS